MGHDTLLFVCGLMGLLVIGFSSASQRQSTKNWWDEEYEEAEMKLLFHNQRARKKRIDPVWKDVGSL